MRIFLRVVHQFFLLCNRVIGRCLTVIEAKRFMSEERETFSKPELTPITGAEFKSLIRKYPHSLGRYYKNRWSYMKEVVRIIKRESPQRVLEIGPRWIPLVKGSDVLDEELKLPHLTYHHDVKRTPWPVESSRYDLVIALQVWEHLGGKQREAFQEVMRISRSAILSFPYKWNCPGNLHHMIDEKVIGEWTLHVKPKKILQVGENGVIGVRVIYHFDFSEQKMGDKILNSEMDTVSPRF